MDKQKVWLVDTRKIDIFQIEVDGIHNGCKGKEYAFCHRYDPYEPDNISIYKCYKYPVFFLEKCDAALYLLDFLEKEKVKKEEAYKRWFARQIAKIDKAKDFKLGRR